MNGITVIETITSDVPSNNAGNIVVIIALIALSIAAAYETIERFSNKRVIEGIITLSVIIVSIFIGLFGSGVFTNSQKEETLYIVTIDDSVSANDFHKMYEIVDINDDKYTVRLINNGQ